MGGNFAILNKLLQYPFESKRGQVCFDSKQIRLFGPQSHVQAVMARGISVKWKQPIYYLEAGVVTEVE